MTEQPVSTTPSCTIKQLLSQTLQRALIAQLSPSCSGKSELARSLVTGESNFAQSAETERVQHSTEAIAQTTLAPSAVIWRVAYLSALAFGAIGTPLQNAETAVRVFETSPHGAADILNFRSLVWLERYVSALLHQHPIDAKNLADAHLEDVLRRSTRSSGKTSH